MEQVWTRLIWVTNWRLTPLFRIRLKQPVVTNVLIYRLLIRLVVRCRVRQASSKFELTNTTSEVKHSV